MTKGGNLRKKKIDQSKPQEHSMLREASKRVRCLVRPQDQPFSPSWRPCWRRRGKTLSVKRLQNWPQLAHQEFDGRPVRYDRQDTLRVCYAWLLRLRCYRLEHSTTSHLGSTRMTRNSLKYYVCSKRPNHRGQSNFPSKICLTS